MNDTLPRTDVLTMADMTRTTLMGSPHPDGGVPLFSSRKRHVVRIWSSNCKDVWEKVVSSTAWSEYTRTHKTRGARCTHLAVVPGARSYLLHCAVVDASHVVQDELLPLLFGIHEDRVTWIHSGRKNQKHMIRLLEEERQVNCFLFQFYS